ncbi:MAG: DUF481 domain-containing protein [Thermoguttaceae bacterium]
MIRASLLSTLVVCVWTAGIFGQQLTEPGGMWDYPFQLLPPVESYGWPATAVASPDSSYSPMAAAEPLSTWLDAAPATLDPSVLPGSVVPTWRVPEPLIEAAAGELPKGGGEESAGKTGEDPGKAAVADEESAPTAWYYAPVQWLDPWEGNVEIGVSGSEGNTQTLNYLMGLDTKRETEHDIVHFDVRYDRKTADSVKTAHRLLSEVRWEFVLKESAWTWFWHETTEYDEFKAFDIRLSYDTGLGRRLIKNKTTSLLARVGAGASHEVGGTNEDLVPEAVFGMEFTHELNERQKVSTSSEYSPDVTDFLDYRLKSKASWEVVLDEETNLSLKMSVLDRYDSTPDGKRPNDLDYTLTLLWSF